METTTIIINDAPYGSERPWNALRLTLSLLSTKQEKKVNIFLMGDAVAIAKTQQKTPPGYYNLEDILTRIIKKGGEVQACGTCLQARGMNQSELIKGIEPSTMNKLTTWVQESNKILTF
ncbi:MAG: DsrE/DsrF/TusD sulfur relay family protein [Candidatus Ranarchaeia archaeon]